MKVDRRSFLGLGLGAVAGFSVSPVLLKLTDDSSIWTQNWPWTPVPADGEVSYANSVCSLCPGSCGISIRKIDNRPVKIEGQDEYPINDGGACMHGISGLQYLYDPSRIKTPLKKNGEKFEEISWEDAIALVAGKLNEIRNSGSPEKFACITDKETGSVSLLFKRLTKTFGSPNYYTMPCFESYLGLTASTVHGKGMTIGFDLANSDFVLSFGAGIIEGWGSPVNCFKSNASRKERGAKLYQIEPRLSNTAANADKWLPAKPGTEADLALGMCALLLKNNLVSSSAASRFKGGLAKLSAQLQADYPLQKTAEITGLKESDIEETALLFAKAKMPVAVFGKGRGDGSQSLKEMVAVHTLNCLSGSINKKGGAFVWTPKKYLELSDESLDQTAKDGVAKARLGQYVHDLFEKVNSSAQPAIEALFVYQSNPCYSLHNAKSMKQAIGKIPFIVSFSSFMDETAKMADVILPLHTFIERLEDIPSGAGLAKTVVGLSKPVVKPIFNTKHPGDILLLLTKAIGGSIAGNFAWDSYEAYLKKVSGNVWNSLSKNGFVILSEDIPDALVEVDMSFLSAGPASLQLSGEGDLILIPIDNMRLPVSVPAASPFAIKTVSDEVIKGSYTAIEINPKTAIGLKNFDFITLTTQLGSAKVMVFLNEGMMPGVVGMVKGLGHTYDNKYVANKGINFNELIGPVIESGSGLDAAFGIRAKISKA